MIEHFYHTIKGYMSKKNTVLLDFVIDSLDNNSVWVELGSWTGKSSAYCAVELYNKGKLKEFHCVDTWKGSEETNQKEMDIVIQDKLFETFNENLSPIKHLIKTHRMFSWEAADYFKNESLDFVYVDADHRYESVIKDLNAFWPKIKYGSYFGGDDYTKGHPGVCKAVNEFFKEKAIKVRRKGRCWYVQKPLL
jgi:cephalosporin hydroxylase